MSGQNARRRCATGGFTIIELTVVLVILSMVASIGIPAYFGRPSVTLDNAARLLAKDLREVQNRAALYEEQLEIRFAEDGDGYQATDAFGEPLVSPYGVGPFLRDYPVDAVFRGVKIKSVDAGPDRAISFGRSGQPLEHGAICIEFKGEERTVRLRARSGLVAIDGLDKPWIDLGG